MMQVTNNDLGNVILANAVHDDETFVAAEAGTTPSGTILARNGDDNLVAMDPAGEGSVTDPVAVLTYDVVAEAPGNIPIRAMVGGLVRRERLIIGDGDPGENIDAAVTDGLRRYGITSVSVTELNILDNQ